MLGDPEFPDWGRAIPAAPTTLIESHQVCTVRHHGDGGAINVRIIPWRGGFHRLEPGQTLAGIDLSAAMIKRLWVSRRGRQTLQGWKRGPIEVLDPRDPEARSPG